MALSTIFASLLEDHLRCASKSFLRLQGRTGQITDYLNLRAQTDARYRERASKSLAARHAATDIMRAGGSVLPALGTGRALVLDGAARVEDLETCFDALQRIPGDSRLGPFHYRPVRFCARPHPDAVILLILAFDALVLGHVQGKVPEDGILISGPTFRHARVRLRPHLDALAPVLARLRLQTCISEEPPLLLNRHCQVCEFKALCRANAIETDNLTLLQGMTPKEVARHNTKGIFTVKQLSYTFRARRPAKRQKQRFAHNFALQALALREHKVHIHGDPNLTLPTKRVYFDIEGLPDRGFYYLIGALVVTDASEDYHCFWADDEGRQVAIFTEFAKFVAEQPECGFFHYGNYEATALRRMIPCVPDAHQKPLAALLTGSINLLSIVSPHVYFPTTSNGLKEVAAFLGCRWTDDGASGLQSVVWREQWEAARDDTMKQRLLHYNQEDCSALRRVTEFVGSVTAHEAAGGSPRHSGPHVYTADLQAPPIRSHRFGKAEFCLPEFEFVNQCAYFDYQRERVTVRERRAPNAGRSPTRRKRRRRGRINSRIELHCDRCALCGSRRITQRQPISATVIDMKFFNGGVKRYVTAYSSWQYRCKKCRQGFRSPEYPETKEWYGNGLQSWILYQNVACGQNMLKIHRSLSDVFSLDMPQPTLYRFKERAAERYRPTAEGILADLLRGPSLHIDETEVCLRKEKGHVWVFAGKSGACYEYRETRNGDFLAERIRGFSGVLVTDFFTAYDSLDCPQQKCLIHLIRDMNEDMRTKPFDTELHDIVQHFAVLIRPIIETVDRYGLVKAHLQKHKKAAMSFIDMVVGQRPASEASAKYQKRIEKYGTRLFTFLDYDGVPWNNNNAEHAIHTFARHRQSADGRFTAKSITDYLVILSGLQTCEYRGVNVLEFLLSGRTDIQPLTVARSSEHLPEKPDNVPITP